MWIYYLLLNNYGLIFYSTEDNIFTNSENYHYDFEILFKQKIAEFCLKYSIELFQNGKKNKICIFWYIGVFEINIYFKLFNKKLLIYWRTYKYLINIKDFFIFYFIILQIFYIFIYIKLFNKEFKYD